MKSLFAPCFALFLALAFATACQAQPAQLIELAAFPKGTLDIQGANQTHHFDIWIAQTGAQQQQGLMFVRDLAENRGMLFIPEKPRVFNMWMMNTFIPLDMVFIGADGRIVKIAERTTPHSTDIISSDVAVAAIVELKGGEAARRALRAGDKVVWHTTR